MPGDDFRRFTPARPVQVRADDGRWLPGLQSAWVKVDGEWMAHVSWSTGVGERYMRCLAAGRVRARE